jgi:hypothetical protein
MQLTVVTTALIRETHYCFSTSLIDLRLVSGSTKHSQFNYFQAFGIKINITQSASWIEVLDFSV